MPASQTAPSRQPHPSLFPRRSDRLSDQECGIRSGTRPVFLGAAVVDLCDIEVALLIGAHAVHAPHTAGEITPRAPGILEVAVEVVLQDPVRAAIGGPEKTIARDVEHMHVRRWIAKAPRVEELAVFVEDLGAVVAAIVDEDPARLRIDGDAV